MFWAACTLAYFGFLHSSEFTVLSLATFSEEHHLGVAEIAVDSPVSPSCLRVRIKASKTDPFHKGCFIHIGRGKPPLCAISGLMAYLGLRGNSPGPLFLLQDGRPLSRPMLISWLRRIMAMSGIQGNYSSHSFQIGVATVAAETAFQITSFKH